MPNRQKKVLRQIMAVWTPPYLYIGYRTLQQECLY